MTKKDLLPGGQAYKLTKADMARGGRRSTTKKSLARQKNCNVKCVLFERCPLKVISEKKYKGKCALKKMPVKIQNKVTNLFMKGETGMVDEMIRALFDLSVDVEKEGSIKARDIYCKNLKDFKEAIYGRKVKQEITGQLDTGDSVSVRDLNKIVEEVYGKKGKKDNKGTDSQKGRQGAG